jgi:3-dehydroquinate synthase
MATLRSLGYNVIIGKTALPRLSAFVSRNSFSSVVILCDENTLQYCLPLLITSCPELAGADIIEIESGEASKSLEICDHIWQTLAENNTDRNALLINLGGGVVSDLGGFCASVYKRGIKFINVPTSLLSMADASVGGKTGIDHHNIKNLVGTFAQPEAVFVDPAFLQTLPQRHIHNGMAEICKMALIADKKFWSELNSGNKKLDPEKLVTRSLELKNGIVLKDPSDKALRKTLNFGHTIAHALEMQSLLSGGGLLHGEAVFSGMIVESHIAWQKKLLSKTEMTEIVSGLKKEISASARALSFDNLISFMRHDKKNQDRKMLFSLPDAIGSCLCDIPVTELQVQKAFDFYNTLGL